MFRLFIEPRFVKSRIVLVGTGWGGTTFLEAIKLDRVSSLTVVSPRNYFLFTPLLPSVAVGTTEPRSIMEPIRQLIVKKRQRYPDCRVEYVEMDAVGIDIQGKQLHCEYVGRYSNVPTGPQTPVGPQISDQARQSSYWQRSIPYDQLVLAPGAKSNTFGVKGVEENCLFLKEMGQARAVRNAILDAFEAAGMCTDEAERKRILHFVIVGGGPTGVEFAAELMDFLNADLKKAYRECVADARVTVIQGAQTILNMFDQAIQKYAEDTFSRIDIHVMHNAKVVSVEKRHLTVEVDEKANLVSHSGYVSGGGALNGASGAGSATLGPNSGPQASRTKTVQVPFGVCVWAAGIAPRRITASVIDAIGGEQKGNALINTDERLRVIGGDGDIYALGDCSLVRCHNLKHRGMQMFRDADLDKDGSLGYDEFSGLCKKLSAEYPLLAVGKPRRLYDETTMGSNEAKTNDRVRTLIGSIAGTGPSQSRKNGGLAGASVTSVGSQSASDIPTAAAVGMSEAQFQAVLDRIERGFKSAPATAQVASQQAQYLAKVLGVPETRDACGPWVRRDLGMMSYVGDSRAVMQSQFAPSHFKGWFAFAVWRGAYTSKLVSTRSRFLVMFDWIKARIFGRDISRM